MIKHILTILVLMAFTGCFFPSDTTTDYENERKEEKSSKLLSSSSVYYSSETVSPPVLDTVLFDCLKDSTYRVIETITLSNATRGRSYIASGPQRLVLRMCTGEVIQSRVSTDRVVTCNYKIYSDNILIDIVKISETTVGECEYISELADFTNSERDGLICENSETDRCKYGVCYDYLFGKWSEKMDCKYWKDKQYRGYTTLLSQPR
jgi:hypothetical protein